MFPKLSTDLFSASPASSGLNRPKDFQVQRRRPPGVSARGQVGPLETYQRVHRSRCVPNGGKPSTQSEKNHRLPIRIDARRFRLTPTQQPTRQMCLRQCQRHIGSASYIRKLPGEITHRIGVLTALGVKLLYHNLYGNRLGIPLAQPIGLPRLSTRT